MAYPDFAPIIKPTLVDNDTGGVVGKVQYGGGITEHATATSSDMTNSTTNINQTYDHTNLHAKFANPNVKQDIPEKGKDQYTKNR